PNVEDIVALIDEPPNEGRPQRDKLLPQRGTGPKPNVARSSGLRWVKRSQTTCYPEGVVATMGERYVPQTAAVRRRAALAPRAANPKPSSSNPPLGSGTKVTTRLSAMKMGPQSPPVGGG